MRRLVVGALLSLLACSTAPGPSPTHSVELTADDARLRPVLEQLVQHPEWTGGETTDMKSARAVASLRHVCVEVERPGLSDLHVSVDVSRLPWQVAAAECPRPQLAWALA
jgi:hypothetical protein